MTNSCSLCLWIIGWIMREILKLLAVLRMSRGAGWLGASIVGLTVFVRALLIPLFIKQIKASRAMSWRSRDDGDSGQVQG